jgi:hypothetical protein
MSDPRDDAVENLLRKTFEGPVADDGFAERVMHKLPRRRHRSGWPTWIGIAAGFAACWLSLLSAPIVSAGWRDWTQGELSAPAIALLLAFACLSLVVSWWTLAEADDR